MEGQDLYKDGLNVYKECWDSIQDHWSDFSTSSKIMNEEWMSIMHSLKEKVSNLRIEAMRKDIENLWEQCFICEQERRRSIIYNNEANLDVAVAKYKEELNTMRDYLQRNKEVIDLIKKYEDSLALLNSSEEPPDEKFKKNRGAILLREEQRRRLLTQVPKLQRAIMKKIKEKETDGFTFLIRGEHFKNIMEMDNKKYLERKSLSITHNNGILSANRAPRRFSADPNKFMNKTSLSHDKLVHRSTSMKF